MGAPDLSNEMSPLQRLAAIETSIEALRAEVVVLREALAGEAKPGRRALGWAKGALLYMADDFDAPLEGFEQP